MTLQKWNCGPLALLAVAWTSLAVAAPQSDTRELVRVPSKDGTLIAVECTGLGPKLLLVHGGTGDRTRWTPMFPFLSSRFRVCAMDRRGHGASGDNSEYSLRKEAEDVAAVVDSLRGPVFVLGHSYGGVAALEAAFLTRGIAKLVLYEPPLQDPDHSAATSQIEALVRAGDRETATVTFLQDVVRVSPGEIAAMKSRPSWLGLVASIGTVVRQDRAMAKYRWDPARTSRLRTPTLLLTGSRTASPELKLAIRGLMDALPNRTLVVLEGQEHNAMDGDRVHLAEVVERFLLGDQEPQTPRWQAPPDVP